MRFSEKLQNVMQQLNISQTQVARMTGKSKGSISMYLSGQTVPSEKTQNEMAESLGLPPDYFTQEKAAELKVSGKLNEIETLSVHEVAQIMHKHTQTIAAGLQQGVFPWGYGIKTSEHRWSYFINKRRFEEIEGCVLR